MASGRLDSLAAERAAGRDEQVPDADAKAAGPPAVDVAGGHAKIALPILDESVQDDGAGNHHMFEGRPFVRRYCKCPSVIGRGQHTVKFG